jgi:Group II intron, maturase-specific domain
VTADWPGGVRHVGDVSPICCSCAERGKACPDTAVGDRWREGACQAAEPQASEYRCVDAPAISNDARNKISEQIRRWRLHRRIGLSVTELARLINPVVRGWMQYYGAFYRSELYPLLSRINSYLMRWIRKKYKRLRTTRKAAGCWQRITWP